MPKAAVQVPKGMRQQGGAQLLPGHLQSSEHPAHSAAQDNTSSSCTWPDSQPTPELIHIIQSSAGETSSEFSCPVWIPPPALCFSAPWEQAVLTPVQCHAAPWLEAVPYTPGPQTGTFTQVCSSQYLWKPNNLGFILFSSSVATCVLDQMELLGLVVIVILLTTCRNAGMSTECPALTLTDLILLPGSRSNATKMNHMGSPSTWGH